MDGTGGLRETTEETSSKRYRETRVVIGKGDGSKIVYSVLLIRVYHVKGNLNLRNEKF